jgi:hypothetical protein
VARGKTNYCAAHRNGVIAGQTVGGDPASALALASTKMAGIGGKGTMEENMDDEEVDDEDNSAIETCVPCNDSSTAPGLGFAAAMNVDDL